MFSNIPTVLLYCSIPFIFCPSNLSTLGISGYSLSKFHTSTVSYIHPKGIGFSWYSDSFEAFSRHQGMIAAKAHINQNLAITPGLSIAYQSHNALTTTAVDVDFAASFSQPKTQSLLYLNYDFERAKLLFTAAHHYQLAPNIVIGASWDSYQNNLDLQFHYKHKTHLFSYRQNSQFLAMSYAFQKKNLWLQITLNTGTYMAPPVLLSQW